MGYDSLIDAETWQFIHRTEAHYPPDAISLSIAEQRRVYDAMCREFFQGYPPGVTAHDSRAGTVPIRVYSSSKSPVSVIYLHGGGFVVGGLESHDDVCAEICARTGFRVVAVDYRLSPEHKHPAAFDDALAATRHVARAHPGRLILAGDSAGGLLAAAVVHALRGEVSIAGQVLIYPALGGDPDRGSYIAHAQAPMLTREDIHYYTAIRADGPPPAADPRFAPLCDPDFTGLPPSLIVSAECDPLSDDGRNYRNRVLAAGGQAVWVNEPGLVHGFLRARTSVRRAGQSFDRIVTTIAGLGAGTWPGPFPPDLQHGSGIRESTSN